MNKTTFKTADAKNPSLEGREAAFSKPSVIATANIVKQEVKERP